MLCFLAAVAWPGLVWPDRPPLSPLLSSQAAAIRKRKKALDGEVCVVYSRQPTWHWSQATKGAGGGIIGWLALELVAPPSVLLVPLHAAAKRICTGVLVTVAMCVPGTGVQRDGCHQWLIIARKPQTSG